MLAAYLKELGQPHLGLGLESLSIEQCDAFLMQLQAYGPETLKKQRSLLRSRQMSDLAAYTSLQKMSIPSEEDRRLGERYIDEGKVGCLILAGGQATRLGCQGPKGMVPVTPLTGKSLFQLFAQRTLRAGKRADRLLPLSIMTSSINHDQICSYFEEHSSFALQGSQLSFFPQDNLPFLDREGNWLLQQPGVLAEGPDGNGNALRCFYDQGLWDKWRNEGIEYLNVIFVDNPLADPFDSAFIGFTARNGLDIGMKVVERMSFPEKMGIVVEKDSRIKVIEYSEFSHDAAFTFRYASPGLFCFSMEFVRHLYEDLRAEAPLHLAQKSATVIPAHACARASTTVFKSETFQFELLDFTEKSAALLYPRRSTYAPLKNAQGEKSPATAREALLEFDKEIYTELSGLPAPNFSFELDPVFYYPTEALKQRMRGCRIARSGYITLESLSSKTDSEML